MVPRFVSLRGVQRFLSEPGEPVSEVVSGYEIRRELARGGTATVYEAWDPRLERRVAIKHLHGSAQHRLRHEALAAARLRHPAIVGIYEVDEEYLVLEFCEGRTLAVAMAEMTLDDRVRVLEEIARAVDHAHTQGVVHRDLKPTNVMIEPDGRVRLTDFGLSKLEWGDDLTATGTVVGTPQYMAPEQVRGRDVGPAADIWALGVLLHEMVSNVRPFDAPTSLAMYARIVHDDPPVLAGPLGAIALKAMEKEPRRRYARASDLADDLVRYRQRQDVTARQLWPRVRRGWRSVRGVAAIAVALTAVAAVAIGIDRLVRPARAPRAAVASMAVRASEYGVESRKILERELSERLQRAPQGRELLLRRAEVRFALATAARKLGEDPLPAWSAAERDLERAAALGSGTSDVYVWRLRIAADRLAFAVKFGLDRSDDCRLLDHPQPDRAAFTSRAMERGAAALRATVSLTCAGLPGVDARVRTRLLNEALAALTPPTNPDAHIRRGRVLAAQGRLAEADAAFLEAARVDGTEQPWLARGIAHLAAGDADTARRHLDVAVRLDPQEAEAWEQRGRARLRLDDRDGAAADMRQAIALNGALGPLLRAELAAAGH